MWSPANSDCKGNYATGCVDGTWNDAGRNLMSLVGKENKDTDEYDEAVILHEWGHYFQAKFSRDDSTGGDHSTGDRLNAALAFSEGFATALAMIFSPAPVYFDTAGPGQLSGAPNDIEDGTCHTAVVLVPQCGTSGFFSESSVMQFLWDLYDGKGADASIGGVVDDVQLGWGPIYRAMTGPLKRASDYTSVYSFLYALASDPLFAPQEAAVNELAGAYHLAPAGLPPGGSVVPDGAYFGEFYTPLTTGARDGTRTVTVHAAGEWAGQPLAFRSTYFNPLDKFYFGAYGSGQKYGARVAIQLVVDEALTYTITVAKTAGSPDVQLYAVLYRDGVEVVKEKSAYNTVSTSVSLTPGTYLLEVRGDAAATFTVSVRKPLF
jgi:hypothetical protein